MWHHANNLHIKVESDDNEDSEYRSRSALKSKKVLECDVSAEMNIITFLKTHPGFDPQALLERVSANGEVFIETYLLKAYPHLEVSQRSVFYYLQNQS
jgi:hypothetical protein